MSAIKHTPGPWSHTSNVESPWSADLDSDAENPSGVSTSQPIIGADDQTVCLVVGVGWQDDELDANARLIAAAPTMDDILRRLIAWDTKFPVNGNNGYAGLKELNVIIAEAKAAVGDDDL